MNTIDPKDVLKEFILVIKKDIKTDKLYLDKIEFEKILAPYLSRLNEKSEFDHHSILDLEDSILNTDNGLKNLYDCYHSSYSPFPNSGYSQESYLRRIDKEKYLETIKSYEDEDDAGRKNYEKSIKNNQVERIALFTLIYYLSEAYKKAEKEPHVVFYSHGTPGWKDRSFMMNDIFKMDFSSNFGYGWSSYFHSILTYNDIKITPYSYLVKYRFANFSEIHRYTRKYSVKYESWCDALTFGIEAYNMSFENPNLFIRKYVFDEVEDMMVGLKDLYNQKDKGKYICNLYKDTWEITDEEVYEVVGEKFHGALNFVESLKKLKLYSTNEVYKDIDSYINEILKMAKDVKDSLKVKKEQFKIIIDQKLTPDLQLKEKEFEKYNTEIFTPLEKEIKTYEQSMYDEELESSKIAEKINQKFPLWISVKKDNEIYLGKVQEVKLQISRKEGYIKKYSEVINNIELYFQLMAA